MTRRNHLVFSIDEQLCAVDIHDVDQVVRAVEPIKVPESPPPMRGLINLRGDFLPLLDVREHFGFPSRPIHPDQRFLILFLSHGLLRGVFSTPAGEATVHEPKPDASHGKRHEIQKMALVVDEVVDVVTLEFELSTGSEQALSGCQGFISHVGKIDGKAVLIFDTERLWTKVFWTMKNGECLGDRYSMNGACEDETNDS